MIGKPGRGRIYATEEEAKAAKLEYDRRNYEISKAIADAGEARRAWEERWNLDFRRKHWVELNGRFWPRPGFEPKGFSFRDRCRL